ncbi:MAG: Maf family protein [Burkholderiales bacterium]|nr:Maf family protein [Burkholderiales bacterium]
MNNKNTSKIYLASKSPRRRELLEMININFEIISIDIPEEVQDKEDYLSYSRRICEEKANAATKHVVENNLPIYPILTADTEVVIDDEVLGKPENYDAAFKMWQKMRGRNHLVITTVTLKHDDFMQTISNESKVYFDNVSDEEIHNYLATGNHEDKSGSYGIQSYAGQFIQRIDGCFYSIMGLPLNTVRNLLKDLEQYLAKN